MGEILVSVCCSAYNHEEYIAQAIESMLMQKTTFDFEILINDDASTDKTTEIIKSYQEKFPNIIKPYYHSVNQFSQGNKPFIYNLKRAEGKYLAFCEGDDYWTDVHKLQKQVDFMESNPDYSMCGHAIECIDATTNKVINLQYSSRGKNTDLHFEHLEENIVFFSNRYSNG